MLHGLPTFALPAAPQLTVVPQRGTGRRSTREAGLRADDLAFWWGIAVTDVARTIVDLARHDRWDAVMAGDAALRQGLVTPDGITDVAKAMTRWPGIVRARVMWRDVVVEWPRTARLLRAALASSPTQWSVQQAN